MRKSRGRNEGSIFRRADGRWSATVSLGYRNGRRWRKMLYGKTRAEVAEKLNAALRDQSLGLPVADPERQTVGDFLARWLETIVKRSTRPKTYESYRDNVRLHIVPALGRIRLEKLRAPAIQRFLNDKLDSGLSPRTVEYLHAILRTALNQAVEWRIIPSNPAMRAKPPRVPRAEIEPFTVAEAQRILAAVEGHRLGALYGAAFALGLRQGEALGLPWSALDFEAPSVTITQALQRVDGKVRFVEPKNDRSRRTIPLPETVRQALLKHRARQAEERRLAGTRWKEHGLVFASSIGTPLHPRNVLRHFHETLKALGIPRRRFHDLRHTAATLLIAQGVPARVIMHILGHSQISTTLDVYGHCLPEMANDAMRGMDRVFDPVAVKLAVKKAEETVQ